MSTEKKQASVTLVVAVDMQRGIGLDNALPWRLPEDLAHFKRTTSGHPIVMGRKTFESIGRALPNRRNIVVTRNPSWRHEGVETADSIDTAIRRAGDEEIFVIGGAQIYAEAMPKASRLIVTEIGKAFSCDAFFPEIDRAQWHETARERHYSDTNQCYYDFVTYHRRVAADG